MFKKFINWVLGLNEKILAMFLTVFSLVAITTMFFVFEYLSYILTPMHFGVLFVLILLGLLVGIIYNAFLYEIRRLK